MSLSTQWLHWSVVTPVLSIIQTEKKRAGRVENKKKGLEVGNIPLPQMYHLISWRYQGTRKFNLLLSPKENKMISFCSVSLYKCLHSWQLRDIQIFVNWMHNHQFFSFLILEFTKETQIWPREVSRKSRKPRFEFDLVWSLLLNLSVTFDKFFFFSPCPSLIFEAIK